MLRWEPATSRVTRWASVERVPTAVLGSMLVFSGAAEAYEPEIELYLREIRTVDPASTEAVLKMSRRHGPLVLPPRDEAWTRATMGRANAQREHDRREHRFSLATEHGVTVEQVIPEEHVKGALRTVQGLTQWFLFTAGAVDEPPTGWGGVGSWGDEASGWDLWAGLVEDGLRDVGPRVMVPAAEFAPPRPVPLYSALCRQLAEDATEDRTVKPCADPTCRALFLRQRGRARHSQHWTKGTEYCTRRCAQRVAAREKRGRDSAARAKGTSA